MSSSKILLVNDKESAKQHYMSVLGFDDEGHGIFVRDGVSVILHENKSEGAARPNYLVDNFSADLYSAVKRVESLYNEYVSKRANIVKELTLEATGMKEFAVKDVDGYILVFGEYVG
ncbi:VOC family protein [Paenibacillus albus]|uniref:Glyoxalase/fosfomycin resistance/dioxygenase domain-containing protein n=1 Tax=Paenibacillus albus TaxID=2495582 RepID=A0A3S9A5G3_9BACL|nr:VOC family protein [Paenibacillus albus]AZN40963.1 hypothetical protein EJC50_15775 [Paenibacillus albus]